MRTPTRFLALLALCALLCLPAPGQFARVPQDSLRNRSAQDSLNRHPDSTRTVMMTVDSSKAKQATTSAPQPEVKKPRSSTLRTVERQTATHAAKNAPRVKNAKPTTR